MSKRGYIYRYLLILRKLKLQPYSSYEDLRHFIENQMEHLQMQDDASNVGFSKRTLQRDIREIENIFGIDIEYSATSKGYFISESAIENTHSQRMLEAFDLFNSLNISQDLSPHVQLEKRRPKGTENLYGLIHAIKNKLEIRFSYTKFEEEATSLRTAEPYAIKEFKNRWYVMAMDAKDTTIKSFALDRLTHLEITNRKFKLPKTYNAEDSYRYCFGILSPNDTEPENIILSFHPVQGKYIKSLPLHETQEILTDNENELRIHLKLFITHDLIMELLSFGADMKVMQPQFLANEIRSIHHNAFKQYKV